MIQVLIVDLGSQYTSLIARAVREQGVRAEILPPQQAGSWLENHKPKAIILSGSYASVRQTDAPEPPQEIFEAGCPILGICYGAQWLVKSFGGDVISSAEKKEYGRTEAAFGEDVIFQDCPGKSVVWASHGDSIGKLPSVFSAIARSGENSQAAAFRAGSFWGVMFHPEVSHTSSGSLILRNFLFHISGCLKDWMPDDIIGGIQKAALDTIGKDARIIIGYSGGVDSSVLAKILLPVFRDRLMGICVNAGNLREGEIDDIKVSAEIIGLNLKIIDAQASLLSALADIIDAEEKRKIFSLVYGQSLQKAVDDFGAAWLLQGTINPDVIETGHSGGAAKIKTHHNPVLEGKFRRYDPLKSYFKDDVRDLARALGLPKYIANKEPFPGPGLIIRVVGCPVTAEKLAIVRWADRQVRMIAQKHNLTNISQLAVILLGVRTVGVKGDERVYGFPVVVRAVETVNFMTAAGYRWPVNVCEEIESALTRHPDIVRVVWDSTPKPPATIEWE
ncbi:MAG: glutamine-hydrolyzing GMP synthase [Candidatus Pacebacteria bacterium]|nr:glutamine-hydrolyzing GMP synthase [Candidatus Paceibacterota bacterium]